MSGRASRGQASVELIALVPVLVAVVVLVWQLAVVVRGALVAEDRVREAGSGSGRTGSSGSPGRLRVPTLLPGLVGLTVPFRGVVRAP